MSDQTGAGEPPPAPKTTDQPAPPVTASSLLQAGIASGEVIPPTQPGWPDALTAMVDARLACRSRLGILKLVYGRWQ
jgi:hypothetical protein